MNVSLTEHYEKFIQSKVKSGQYFSASEVVREALRLLEEQDKIRQLQLDELRQEIQKGIDSGPSTAWTKDTIEDIKKRGREKLKALQKDG